MKRVAAVVLFAAAIVSSGSDAYARSESSTKRMAKQGGAMGTTVIVYRGRGCMGAWAAINGADPDLRDNKFTDGTTVYNRISGWANPTNYYLFIYDGLNYKGDSDYFPREDRQCNIYNWDNRISSLKLG